MRLIPAVILSTLAFAAPAHAAVTATPMTTLTVQQGTQIATLFQTDNADVLDLNSMSGWKVDTSTGSACPSVTIRRGTTRLRCTLPAGASVWYYGSTIGNPTYTTAYSTAGSVRANVTYTVTANPNPVTYFTWSTSTCGRPWMRYYQNLGC